MPLFTVGHGTRSVEELVEVLKDAGVGRLVDIRRFPGSRRSPHLSASSLGPALDGLGLEYDWQGEALGGRRQGSERSRHPAWREPALRAYADHMDSAEFRGALDALLAGVARAEAAGLPASAVMCAETLWWRCHRRLVADAAVLAGTPVVHLMGQGKAQPHRVSEFVRPDEEGRPVYDVGCDLGML